MLRWQGQAISACCSDFGGTYPPYPAVTSCQSGMKLKMHPRWGQMRWKTTMSVSSLKPSNPEAGCTNFTFCGRRSSEGPYCHEHSQVAYQPAQTGKKKGSASELARSLRRYI